MKKKVLALMCMAALLMMGSCNGNGNQAADTPEVTEDSAATEQVADTSSSSVTEQQEVTTLTPADVAGIYEGYDEVGGYDSRIVLYDNGTATWNMVGSTNSVEYTYTIKGGTICLLMDDAEAEEDCYDYDPVKKTLSNEQGETYQYQDGE